MQACQMQGIGACVGCMVRTMRLPNSYAPIAKGMTPAAAPTQISHPTSTVPGTYAGSTDISPKLSAAVWLTSAAREDTQVTAETPTRRRYTCVFSHWYDIWYLPDTTVMAEIPGLWVNTGQCVSSCEMLPSSDVRMAFAKLFILPTSAPRTKNLLILGPLPKLAFNVRPGCVVYTWEKWRICSQLHRNSTEVRKLDREPCWANCLLYQFKPKTRCTPCETARSWTSWSSGLGSVRIASFAGDSGADSEACAIGDESQEPPLWFWWRHRWKDECLENARCILGACTVRTVPDCGGGRLCRTDAAIDIGVDIFANLPARGSICRKYNTPGAETPACHEATDSLAVKKWNVNLSLWTSDERFNALCWFVAMSWQIQ